MRIGLLTREYPPEVYGGAGVHVEHLVPALRALGSQIRVEVHCFGEPRAGEEGTRAHRPPGSLAEANPALQTLGVDLSIVASLDGMDGSGGSTVDVVHSHTWYANMAGHLAKVLHDVPHVITAHSLEPRRPWKAEQLGGGYRLSSWAERTAYEHADAVIAVSEGMRADVLDCYPALDPARVHVVHNGIDTDRYRPVPGRAAVAAAGVDPDRPMVVFLGRITRQKGLGHLIEAAHAIDRDAQIVLCAGAPDTPDIAEETEKAVAELSAARPGVVWMRRTLETAEIRELLSAATVFVCPSVYEPLGIVNLEAMACGTAVVASDVGGIPEVVADGETGTLVHFDEHTVEEFHAGLAGAVNALLRDPARAAAMGAAGRARAQSAFSWTQAARRTVEIYRSL
ncbi:glycogen synthase [Pseudonocardia asaccharolytica]|uniref:Putative glycosyltransferase n=1 Tax=Pseudonocardia asaccharolytica DSM 44247 = NBRC 16224 TaxID=1123024 RepID=A0A511D4Q7_9PSEU|nr:glycogen synthase [Pseudonocardia asaccharolytica]GEL18584.1 putative glycosyltransferase [Pseudonocardia asaccharolytica DSM 44247 = NBRC 16224]